MIKIGLITTQFAINFGAVLQAYALRKKIENIGYDCEIISYFPNYKVGGRNNIPLKFNSLKNTVLSFIYLLNLKYQKDYQKKIEKFNKFLNKECNLSEQKYYSYLELKNKLPKYDCLVCGSDQIWNLNLFSDPSLFLRFENIYPDINYIAYAPSIAENLTDRQYESIIKKTHHFSAISIREKNAANILNKYSDINIKNVLDPVFLLSEE